EARDIDPGRRPTPPPPLSEQRCKDICADCQKQDGNLSFDNMIPDGNACVTETTYSESGRPNDDAGNQERPGAGKDWPGAGGKPQQNWERPADRQQYVPGFSRQRNNDQGHDRERKECDGTFDIFPPGWRVAQGVEKADYEWRYDDDTDEVSPEPVLPSGQHFY